VYRPETRDEGGDAQRYSVDETNDKEQERLTDSNNETNVTYWVDAERKPFPNIENGVG
jgi:hypothetical protein